MAKNYYAEETDTQKMHRLIDFIETFEYNYPELLHLADACGTIRKAISMSKRISSRFKDIQNFHKTIAYYKGIGWFKYIEYKEYYNFEIEITICMCERNVEDHIYTLGINQPLYDSSIEYRDALKKASYDMMIKYGLGSRWEKDPINVIVKHFEELGETTEMFNKRFALFKNTIMIVHTELWNSILTDLGNSNMCFSVVDLRNNNLKTLPLNFLYINDNADRVDLRNNDIVELPCQKLDQCIVDWKTISLLPEIHNRRIRWFTENPINVAVIQNHCYYPIEFLRIQQTDGSEILRFIGHSYGKEALSDEECMKIINDIHEKGEDINCSVVNTNRLYRSYDPSPQHLQEIQTQLSTLSTDMSSFVTIN